jgi:uncharacterized protein (TIGR02246 family)
MLMRGFGDSHSIRKLPKEQTMKSKACLITAGVCWTMMGLFIGAANGQTPKSSTTAAGSPKQPISKDEEAIRKGAGEFSKAFEKGDTKAIAAMWVEHGEYEDDQNKTIRGRDAIEKAYMEIFEQKKGGKIDVEIQSVRFLTLDLAVEEGLLRETSVGRELPSTTRYSAIDVRENGQWKIAQCREWGVGQDHLDDLNWLVGKWKGAAKDDDRTLSFAWDEKQPILVAKLTSSGKGKSAAATSGTIKIGYDPRRGQLHSWHTDDAGGHGQAMWNRDGYRWVMNATGLTGDGKETAAQNILQRIDNSNFTWRSINRRLGDQPVPDTAPIKLTRVADGK